MLPGISPCGRKLELPTRRRDGRREWKVTHEHIYWDQGSLLAQIGLLDPAKLPITGAEQARKLLNPNWPRMSLFIEQNALKPKLCG
jgi:carboxymethylenebutenolidase